MENHFRAVLCCQALPTAEQGRSKDVVGHYVHNDALLSMRALLSWMARRDLLVSGIKVRFRETNVGGSGSRSILTNHKLPELKE